MSGPLAIALHLDLRQFRLRQREDQRDRFDLRDHDEAVGVGRMDDVADIDLPHAGDPGNRRSQPGVAELDLGRSISASSALIALCNWATCAFCVSTVAALHSPCLPARVAIEIGERIGELRLIAIARGGHLVELRLVGPRIDLGQQVAGLDGLPFGEGDLRSVPGSGCARRPVL